MALRKISHDSESAGSNKMGASAQTPTFALRKAAKSEPINVLKNRSEELKKSPFVELDVATGKPKLNFADMIIHEEDSQDESHYDQTKSQYDLLSITIFLAQREKI